MSGKKHTHDPNGWGRNAEAIEMRFEKLWFKAGG
jgi:hypothetical protein